MEMKRRQTYADDGSGSVLATAMSSKKRLATRQEPFGIRLYSWYTLGGGELLGEHGGQPGFIIEPAAVQLNECDRYTLTSAESKSLDIPVEYFVDGGCLWVPWPATVYLSWPDRWDRNIGTVYWSNTTWEGEGQQDEFAYTRLLANGQSIEVDRYASRVICPAPGTGIEIDGTAIILQTGSTTPVLVTGKSITMRFLAVPAGVTHAPVRFYYYFK